MRNWQAQPRGGARIVKRANCSSSDRRQEKNVTFTYTLKIYLHQRDNISYPLFVYAIQENINGLCSCHMRPMFKILVVRWPGTTKTCARQP